MITTDQMKKAAAKAALDYIENGAIIGIGTGSTVNYFIDALAQIKHRIEGALSSSIATTTYLKTHGITVLDPNSVTQIPLYVDGTDEFNDYLCLVKGGGAALTGEKIIAALAKTFICIADHSKKVKVLGKFPLPIEVIPMARSYVAREIMKLGGDPVYRQGVVTDYGNVILDIHNLTIAEPIALEKTLNNISGVVSNGIFAQRGADKVLMGTPEGVLTLESR